MKRLELFLVRHARSIHEKGHVPPRDPEADVSNKEAFLQLAKKLPHDVQWWVSPLTRCRMTAENLQDAGGQPKAIQFDERLKEQDYGQFHGRAVAEVWEDIKDGPKSNWHFMHPSFCPPEGESFLMLHDRTRAVMDAIESTSADQLVIIGHAMLFKSLIAHALKLPPEQGLAFTIDPLSLCRMTLIQNPSENASGGKWSLDALNLCG